MPVAVMQVLWLNKEQHVISYKVVFCELNCTSDHVTLLHNKIFSNQCSDTVCLQRAACVKWCEAAGEIQPDWQKTLWCSTRITNEACTSIPYQYSNIYIHNISMAKSAIWTYFVMFLCCIRTCIRWLRWQKCELLQSSPRKLDDRGCREA